MRHLEIKIDYDSPVFKDRAYELASILENIAKRIVDNKGINGAVVDSLGNVVGYVKFPSRSL